MIVSVLGCSALNGAHAELPNQRSDGAIALGSLLARICKVKRDRPILVIGKVFPAFDQENAKQDLCRRKGHPLQALDGQVTYKQFAELLSRSGDDSWWSLCGSEHLDDDLDP